MIKQYKLEFKKQNLSLLRIPGNLSDETPIKAEYKNESKELKLTFEIKQKSSNNTIELSAVPSIPLQYFYCYKENNKIILNQIERVYLLRNNHINYKSDYSHKSYDKAQSREELEMKKKNINYKLKKIQSESSVDLLIK
ncbi:hypothetical protein A0H76_1840 [Hepatospora eriocheir]|uniref:Uncharacterized protein n=1 Tax=Hepatospora eriocheir TaxID=1081669 RepID=A0A1X0QGE5_9MICR|nr:hypothetical protein HERIO_943 [Hepatospora eriocheir]ORD98848.1 hypothetical protein A0H76_1840 [Hepatospora eriocheir]